MNSLNHPRTRTMRALITTVLTFVVLVTTSLSPLRSVEACASLAEEVDSTIAELMTLYDVPGVSVAIVQNDAILYSKGYGLGDTTSGQRVDDRTAFGLGSVTKSITALGVQLLVEEGKLDLDRPIINYLPDLKLSDEKAQNTLALRQLLSHTSGLSPVDTGAAVLVASKVSRAEFIQMLATFPLIGAPGETFAYANQNFVLAGLVIERVTGQSWEEFTQARILQALKLENASFDQVGLKKSDNAAAPHDLDVLKGMIPVDYTLNLSAIGPAASLNASALDMAAYALFQLNGRTTGGTLNLTDERLTEMHSAVIQLDSSTYASEAAVATPEAQPSTTDDASLLTDTGYGLGWFTERYRDLNLVQHGGNIVGYSSSITLVPEKKLGIVILTNANYANLMIDAVRLRLIEIALGLPAEQDIAAYLNQRSGFEVVEFKARLLQAKSYRPAPDALQALTGTYSSSTGNVAISTRDEKLYMQFETSGNTLELIPYTADGFLANSFPYRGSRVTFRTDANGTTVILGDPDKGLQLAVRTATGVLTKEVKDPNGRFSLTVPAELTVQQVQGLTLIVQPSPQLIVVSAAYAKMSDDLLADYEAFTRSFDPNFKQKPDSTEVAQVNGLNWTVYEYTLPSNQVSINYVLQKGEFNYTFGYACSKDDLEELLPIIEGMLNSFTIG